MPPTFQVISQVCYKPDWGILKLIRLVAGDGSNRGHVHGQGRKSGWSLWQRRRDRVANYRGNSIGDVCY
ncbi:hypothetical protein MCP1_70142 [Candidatus Terasakiella magnetica]|nr:hypothetical protein MCP1_70142 [Candidatus Terasakiella magnetica]